MNPADGSDGCTGPPAITLTCGSRENASHPGLKSKRLARYVSANQGYVKFVCFIHYNNISTIRIILASDDFLIRRRGGTVEANGLQSKRSLQPKTRYF